MADNVIVTGGAGYIGSHTCKVLAALGFEPITYDNLSRGHEWAVRWGPLEVGELGDANRLTEVLRRYRPVAVLHFAGLAYVGESVANPESYYVNNVAGSLSLLRAMLAHEVRHLVFSSSCSIYGESENQPIDETTPAQPVNPYAEGKWMVERILRDYERAYGLRSVSLRYFNAAGADPDAEIGEDHDPESHLIPRAILTAIGDLDCIDVYGVDYDTRDGTAVRDYIHVDDLARAHTAALGHLLGGRDGDTVNLGTGRGHSVREVVKAVERVSGRRVPIRETARRPGDPSVLIADPTRAREIFGWTPEFVDLDAIVATAWRWHRSRPTSRT